MAFIFPAVPVLRAYNICCAHTVFEVVTCISVHDFLRCCTVCTLYTGYHPQPFFFLFFWAFLSRKRPVGDPGVPSYLPTPGGSLGASPGCYGLWALSSYFSGVRFCGFFTGQNCNFLQGMGVLPDPPGYLAVSGPVATYVPSAPSRASKLHWSPGFGVWVRLVMGEVAPPGYSTFGGGA